MRRTWLVSFLIFCFSLFPCWAQSGSASAEGRITGTVWTEDGQVASGATACVWMRSGSNATAHCPVSADEGGRFTIDQLKPGNYGVFAINDAEGYSMDNQAPGQNVTLTAAQPWVDVTVHLHSRGGILMVTVTDKLTGKPVPESQIQYTAIDANGSGGMTYSSGGKITFSVPSNCDVVLVAMAKGYKGWIYTDPSNPSRPVLRLASGERKVMSIQLEPLASNSVPR